MTGKSRTLIVASLAWLISGVADAQQGPVETKTGQQAAPTTKPNMTYPPKLPGGRPMITSTSAEFLRAPTTIRDDVVVAKIPPRVDFLYYPNQTYQGNPWSNWGDSLAVNGKYYASIGDHLAPGGNAFVYEYDPTNQRFRQLVDLRKLLNLPDGHYTPGKIHSRIDLGEDGWLYTSTHRGSTRVTNDRYHFKGDWLIRIHPETGEVNVLSHGPVPKHCLPAGVLDPKRLIYYGGTTPGEEDKNDGVRFFAYDTKSRKVLCDLPNGPSRSMILATSSGRVYYTPGTGDSPLMRYTPGIGNVPEQIEGKISIRAATQETPQGLVYTVSFDHDGREATLYAFNTKTEKVKILGPAAVGREQYIATLDADPTGRYIYYMPGAHGGSESDGAPVVQFDTQTNIKKIIAFLHPFTKNNYGCTLKGTYSAAVTPEGDKLFVTWNVSRDGRVWDACALTVIHIPESERRP